MQMSAREKAKARRKALAGAGKTALATQDRSRASSGMAANGAAAPAARPAAAPATTGMSAREAALARRRALSQGGKKALGQTDRTRAATAPTRANTRSGTQPRAAAPQPAPVRERSRPASRRPVAPVAPVAAPASPNSARAASLARRKALSTRGKVALQNNDRVRDAKTRMTKARGKAGAAPATAGETGKSCGCSRQRAGEGQAAKASAVEAPRGKALKGRPVRQAKPALSVGRAASLARRRALSTRGKAGISAAGITPAQAVRSTNPEMSGREMARALRKQRSQNGGAGQKKCAPSGRRMRVCKTGEGAAAADQSWKVGISETTHGQSVTGTKVGRSRAVTGDEPSTCRTITGTEYLGADIFREFCQSEPAKSVVRSGVSATAGGNQVTGNKTGRSVKVTGDEPGTCKRVTGTEYVGAELTEAFCGTRPAPNPPKIAIGETAKRKPVTGALVLRSERVTGNETGFDRELTGTPYTQLGEGGAPPKVRRSTTLSGRPVTGTLVGRRQKMTGDEMGSCRTVTGDDYAPLEQFEQFCETVPAPSKHKVGASSTFTGETVTGTMTGRASRVTGDEPGTCKAITGTPYAGLEQYGTFCEAPQANMAAARMFASKRVAGAPMTGIQPAVGGKMTGDERGACEIVSGTPYIGEDQMAAVCARPVSADRQANGAAAHRAMNRAGAMNKPAPRANGAGQAGGVVAQSAPTAEAAAYANGAAVAQPAMPAAMPAMNNGAVQTNGAAAQPAVPAQPAMNGAVQANGMQANGMVPGAAGMMPAEDVPWGRFSVTAPVHASQMLEHSGGVTGTGYENGHITGPFGMADGKVTGTEEARFGRPLQPAEVPAEMRGNYNPQTSGPGIGEVAGRVKARITGEGQDAGLKITGDDWERGGLITGTEGPSARRRNPTRQGSPMVAMAQLRRGSRNEDVPPPVNKVTGSSGNTDAGALITYSGGARG